MKLIPLTQGQFAVVDDSDYEWLNQWKWYANRNRYTYYAVRSDHTNGIIKQILMHREIMNTPNGMVVHHIDHNGLNNQRCNLKNCTESENQKNQRIRNYSVSLQRVNADNPLLVLARSVPQINNLGDCYQLSLNFKHKNNKKHGLSYIKEYDTFLNMRSRCYKENNPSYKNYGARGIKICDEWLNNPKLFIDYVKSIPNYGIKNYSLDRIDNDGNYEPGNLRWASQYVQTMNRRIKCRNTKQEDIIKSDISGIVWDNNKKKWRIRFFVNGKRTSFGYSKTIEDAIIKRDRGLASYNLNDYETNKTKILTHSR